MRRRRRLELGEGDQRAQAAVSSTSIDGWTRRDRRHAARRRRGRSCSRRRWPSIVRAARDPEVHGRGDLPRARRLDARRLALARSRRRHERRTSLDPRARDALPRRLVGHRDADRERGRALRDDDRLVLLPAVQERRTGRRRASRAEARSCRSIMLGVLLVDDACRCGAPRALRAPRRWLAARAALAGGLLRDARSCVTRTTSQSSRRSSTHTARSTTRCSAPTTRHVAVGLLLNVWLLWKLLGGMTRYRATRCARSPSTGTPSPS